MHRDFAFRAEDLQQSMFQSLADNAVASHVTEALKRRLTSPDTYVNPTILVGPKGSGKTFAALCAAHGLKGKVKFYVYRKNGAIEDISGRFKLGADSPNIAAYVFDDIHYLYEAVLNGEENVSTLERFIENAISIAKQNIPVLIISEGPPSIYFESLSLKNHEELSYSHLLYMEPLSFNEWRMLVNAYNIPADKFGLQLTFWLSSRPRFFLKLAAKVGSLTFPHIIMKANEILKEKKRRSTIEIDKCLVDVPPKVLAKLDQLGAWRIQRFESEIALLRYATKEAAAVIRKNSKNPYPKNTPHYKRWAKDDAYTLKTTLKIQKHIALDIIHKVLQAVENVEVSEIAPLLYDYIMYDYEVIRGSSKKYLRLEKEINYYVGGGDFSLNPRPFIEAFQDCFEHTVNYPSLLQGDYPPTKVKVCSTTY
ncbi:MAG: hypothetical protein NWF09_09620 [Candidatus Bathyarchaeota archaeon]|nr:hypothetical protein [Candidatus Bathyarchaeota archaeon]